MQSTALLLFDTIKTNTFNFTYYKVNKKMDIEKIFVTKTFLPSFDEYAVLLRDIFERKILTNQGKYAQQLEQSLEQYLGVDRLQFVCNGTVAIQLALRALDLQGAEIITTPFSYVATVSSLLWEGCRPVFVDIETDYYTIDPCKIEAAVTPLTRAILAVHVFGKSCNIEKIQTIAKKYNLKVIYDGAHSFGATYKGKSILSYGDISTLSFHSTKLYHTVEGGACISSSSELNEKINLLKRFGHVQDDHYILGINAKQSEIHAAMGIANLKHIDSILASRKAVCEKYQELLSGVVRLMPSQPESQWNYSYFPVVFDSEADLLRVFAALEKKGVFARRYFYPSLNRLPYLNVRQSCPVSEDISNRIACLPLYPDLHNDHIKRICSIIKNTALTTKYGKNS